MSEQENVQVVQGLYGNFNVGDITAVLGVLSDDVAWVSPSISRIPFALLNHDMYGANGSSYYTTE